MEPLLYGIITSLFLFALRWVIVPDSFYIFLPYNLFLALIPLILSWLIVRYTRQKHFSQSMVIVASVIWLLFYPNAPYIMTDFIHLGKVSGVPLWFDALLILSYASTGLLSGHYSLYLMHRMVTKAWGICIGWVFALSTLTLASVGVYLGRFLRWNSWDLFLDPFRLINDIFFRIASPSLHIRFWIISGFLLGFLIMSYEVVYLSMQKVGKSKKR